jgi:hypothetical protein
MPRPCHRPQHGDGTEEKAKALHTASQTQVAQEQHRIAWMGIENGTLTIANQGSVGFERHCGATKPAQAHGKSCASFGDLILLFKKLKEDIPHDRRGQQHS